MEHLCGFLFIVILQGVAGMRGTKGDPGTWGQKVSKGRIEHTHRIVFRPQGAVFHPKCPLSLPG